MPTHAGSGRMAHASRLASLPLHLGELFEAGTWATIKVCGPAVKVISLALNGRGDGTYRHGGTAHGFTGGGGGGMGCPGSTGGRPSSGTVGIAGSSSGGCVSPDTGAAVSVTTGGGVTAPIRTMIICCRRRS